MREGMGGGDELSTRPILVRSKNFLGTGGTAREGFVVKVRTDDIVAVGRGEDRE